LSKQTNNIVANKICVVSKIGLGTGIFGKMAVKGLTGLIGYAGQVYKRSSKEYAKTAEIVPF